MKEAILNALHRFSMPYPTEKYDSFKQYWVDHAKEFPRFADIETTPFCDAKCRACQSYNMTKEKGIMSYEAFVDIADLLKKHNCPIRGMYTTGNPLLDPTIFEKFAYARKIKAMASYSDFNTTTSLLTKELHHKILDNTDNITLSFFAVGSEFERLTGGLNWQKCYENAIAFIKERDRYRPNYRIFIGCNAVVGNDLDAVKYVFRNYNVEYIRDAELRWAGPVVTGVVDRAIMHPLFRCDGHEGMLMIKWNGNIEACSYDFHEETLYANIFKDDWETIRSRFFESWQKPFHLCSRCDYYHKYWAVKKNRFHNVTYDSWQKPFLKEGQPYQQ
jgi:MoaA/NifB/PqqE/SkfB family radical SAM enzyme